MAKKQEINQIEQILSAKKKKFPVLPTFSLAVVLLIGAIFYFDFFNLFGEEIKEIEYKNNSDFE